MNTVVSSASAAVDSEKRVRIDLVGVYKDNDLLEENLEFTKDKLDSNKKKSSFITSEQILELQKAAEAAKKLKEAVQRKHGSSNYLYGFDRGFDDEDDEFCEMFDRLTAADGDMQTSNVQRLKGPKRQNNLLLYFNLELATRLAEKRRRREHFVDVVRNEMERAQSAVGASRRVQSALPTISKRKQVIEIDERTGRVLPSCGKAVVINTKPVRSRRNLAEISNKELTQFLAKRQKDPWVELKRQSLEKLCKEKEIIDSRVNAFVKNIESFKKQSASSGLEKLVTV